MLRVVIVAKRYITKGTTTLCRILIRGIAIQSLCLLVHSVMTSIRVFPHDFRVLGFTVCSLKSSRWLPFPITVNLVL